MNHPSIFNIPNTGINVATYKGALDCSGTPNYPAANAGEYYRVSVAGKIGGASGSVVTAGDMIVCNTDGTVAGTQAAVGAYWDIIQGNIDLTAPGAIGGTTPAAGTFTDLLGNDVAIAVSTDLAITSAQMKGQIFVCAAANNPVLPAAAVGLKGSFIANSANQITIDCNATPGTDVIVLAGTALTAGNKVRSDGSQYSEIYIECKIAGKWIATPIQGIWLDGGA
jgi:hypothetical protein